MSLARLDSSEHLQRYHQHLEATVGWLMRSVEQGSGGSCAFFKLYGGWSKPYPETTGYLIPTLLNYASFSGDSKVRDVAVALGEWLLSIQSVEGYWHGMFHPPPRPQPSIFNTAQILLGMCALAEETSEERWTDAALRGASWLARGVDDEGEWAQGHYRNATNPAYYTRVAWPMLATWHLTGEEGIRAAAERVLYALLRRRRDNGAFKDWGFAPSQPAFTHTIAYTLRGFVESARLLDDWETFGRPTEEALDHLLRKAELGGGRLPGAFDEAWQPVRWYTCLTGNVQVASCLLLWHEREGDLRLVNAASKLVDTVCQAQYLRHPLPGVRGAVAGSRPVWGRYLFLRYPNWAAKFHCDALMQLTASLRQVGL